MAWKAAALYREDTIAPEVLVAELLVLVLSSSTMVPVALLRPVYTIAPAQARGTQIFPLDSQGFPPSWPDNGAWPRIIIGLFLQPGLRVVALGELFSSLVAPCGQRASVKDVYQNHQTVISNLEREHHARGKQTWWSYKTFRRKKIISYNNEIRTLWLKTKNV